MGSAHPTLGGDYSDGDAQVEEWKANVIDGDCSSVTQDWLENSLGLTEDDFDASYLDELFESLMDGSLILTPKKLNKSPSFNLSYPTGGTGIRASLEAAGANDCICLAVDTSADYNEDDEIDTSTCEA